MAKNYTRPLAEVYQLLEVTRQATGDHLSACIVGPTYDLYRYGIEKDVDGETYKGTTNATLNIVYNREALMTYKLDNESIAVYANNVETVVCKKDDSLTWTAVAGSNRKLTSAVAFTDTTKFVRQPVVGDIIYVKGNVPTSTVTSWQRRTIIDVDILNSTVTVDAPFVFGTGGTTTCAITAVTSGYIPAKGTDGTTNWTHTDDADVITFPAALKVDGMDLLSGAGTLYPEFRVLKYSNSEDEDIFEITTIADIQNNFGTIDILNELAYGCYCALRGSAGRAIYAIRTAGTSEEAFEKAMKKTEFDSSVYSFAPLTADPDVAEVVVKYNEAMSAPDIKMWRRTLVGVDNPGEYTLASVGNDAKDIKGTVAKGTDANTGTITITSGNLNLKSIALEGTYVPVRPGDKIIVGGSTTYTVIGTTSETVAEIYAAGGVTAATGATVKIVKADTVANTIQYVGAVASKYSSRRASVVFCDGGTVSEDDRVVVVPNRFLAAEIAGISSAVVPQQSITHTVIQSITKAVHMYSRYTTAQLDDIASQGVLIVTQDTKGTDCYIRHQLTTEMDKGNLYFEESCTRNLDNISYALADIVNGYIGRANVTTSALRAIKIDITAALTEFTQNSTDDMVGPSLINWDNLEVYQDPKFKDRVIINVNLYLPLPLNNIKLFAMAYVAEVSI
jgi:hypothetical protein